MKDWRKPIREDVGYNIFDLGDIFVKFSWGYSRPGDLGFGDSECTNQFGTDVLVETAEKETPETFLNAIKEWEPIKGFNIDRNKRNQIDWVDYNEKESTELNNLQRQKIMNIFDEYLEDVYICTRDWEGGWYYGTMDENDFMDIRCSSRIDELATAILNIM